VIFLTKEELRELTRRNRSSAQVVVLRFMGIEHKIRPDGSVVVLRAHVEHLLGGIADARVPREVQPDWSAV
jgi:hypothetical protein